MGSFTVDMYYSPSGGSRWSTEYQHHATGILDSCVNLITVVRVRAQIQTGLSATMTLHGRLRPARRRNYSGGNVDCNIRSRSLYGCGFPSAYRLVPAALHLMSLMRLNKMVLFCPSILSFLTHRYIYLDVRPCGLG